MAGDHQGQFEFPAGPDFQHPDWIFRDGQGLGCVRSMPVQVPTWGTRAINYDFEAGLFLLLVAALRRIWWKKVLRHHDDRWKVVVSRSRRRLPCVFRTVAIEFCETEEDAQVRQIALLRGWPQAAYASLTPMGPRDRRKARLSSFPS